MIDANNLVPSIQGIGYNTFVAPQRHLAGRANPKRGQPIGVFFDITFKLDIPTVLLVVSAKERHAHSHAKKTPRYSYLVRRTYVKTLKYSGRVAL